MEQAVLLTGMARSSFFRYSQSTSDIVQPVLRQTAVLP